MKNTKQKGSQWERNCAKLLSLWLSDNTRDDLVWRTSGSGNRHSIRKKRGKDTYNQAGDLCATDPCVQFFFDYFLVECKNGYSKGKVSECIDPLYILDKLENTKQSILIDWWNKAEKERLQSNRKHSIILFKRTAKRPCIVHGQKLIWSLADYIGEYPGDQIIVYSDLIGDNNCLVICDLEKWLSWCDPAWMKEVTARELT